MVSPDSVGFTTRTEGPRMCPGVHVAGPKQTGLAVTRTQPERPLSDPLPYTSRVFFFSLSLSGTRSGWSRSASRATRSARSRRPSSTASTTSPASPSSSPSSVDSRATSSAGNRSSSTSGPTTLQTTRTWTAATRWSSRRWGDIHQLVAMPLQAMPRTRTRTRTPLPATPLGEAHAPRGRGLEDCVRPL